LRELEKSIVENKQKEIEKEKEKEEAKKKSTSTPSVGRLFVGSSFYLAQAV